MEGHLIQITPTNYRYKLFISWGFNLLARSVKLVKKHISIYYILIIILSASCGVGLKTLVPPPQRIPIQIDEENLPKILVAKINSQLLPGQVIGGHFDGFAKMRIRDYYAQGMIDSWQEAKYKEIIYSELQKAGYSVPDYSNLFGETQKYNIRFLLGANITNIIMQSFGPNAGNFTEVFLEVEWELFDRDLNKSAFLFKTHGYGKFSGVTSEATLIAFRNCIRNLLAETSFVELVRKQKVSSNQNIYNSDIFYNSFNPDYDTSQINFDKYLDAVFAIKTEDGHGSGFIINSEGYSITCHHVVENRSSLEAIFSDGKNYKT
ncbi:MAG: hypothetical protein KatS3mg036_0374 [Ignavibacterium sp.]|nr:MAG: hypothetical protein KatS3mg036_0374 [Ignavibacterium sp.]